MTVVATPSVVLWHPQFERNAARRFKSEETLRRAWRRVPGLNEQRRVTLPQVTDGRVVRAVDAWYRRRLSQCSEEVAKRAVQQVPYPITRGWVTPLVIEDARWTDVQEHTRAVESFIEGLEFQRARGKNVRAWCLLTVTRTGATPVT